MNTNIRRHSLFRNSLLLLGSVLVLANFGTAPAAAQTTGCPANYTMVSGVCFPNNTGLSSQPVEAIIMSVMNWMLAVLGFIAVLSFVISGYQYLTAAGDDEQIEDAKRNLKYSIIGVVVALSGRVLIMAINNLLKAGTNF